MCPANMTNLQDGSTGCPTPVQPGTNLTMRYAVIVSFGIYLNGTGLADIASTVSDISGAGLLGGGVVEPSGATHCWGQHTNVHTCAEVPVEVPVASGSIEAA